MIKEFVKFVLSGIDRNFKTSFYGRGSRLVDGWYDSNFLNAIRRNLTTAILKLKYGIGMKNRRPLKLHWGCGNQYIEDYINID